MLCTEVESVRIGSVDIAYRRVGDRHAHPVVLLHALGDTGATWDPLVALLAARRRSAVIPDLRGHGRSSWTDEYSFASMRADVVGLLDQLAIDQCDLVGHSMGGHVASLIAEAEAGRVRRLVIEDSPPPPRNAEQEWELRTRGRGVDRRPLLPPLRELGSMCRSGQLDRRAVRVMIDGLRRSDPAWWRRLASITAKTLLISGGPESFVPQASLAAVADKIPDAVVARIDAGHYVHRGQPWRFNSLVAEFLDQRYA